MKNIESQLKLLKVYAGILTIIVLVLIALVIVLFKDRGNFKEITAERINIMEADGKTRMVISNQERQHSGTIDGKLLPKRDRPAGMIFFNDDGDECGGLIFDGNKQSASMTYSIDQYKNDQIMQLQYQQKYEAKALSRSYGFKLWDRSDNATLGQLVTKMDSLHRLKNSTAIDSGMKQLKEQGYMGQERMFVGKTLNGEVGLFLKDSNGVPRLKIYINAKNQPVIETLNDKGEVRE